MRFRVRVKGPGSPEPLVEQVFDCQVGESISFGRALAKNDLVLPDPRRMISGRHGNLECRADGLYVVDAGSLNGTQHGGRAVDSQGSGLADSDTIEVGGCVLEVERLKDREAPVRGVSQPASDNLYEAALAGMRTLAETFLPESRLDTPEDVKLFTKLLRQLSESSLTWMARALQGRAAFEQEFGAEVTLVLQRGKNPLKHLSADDLGRYLLDWSHDDETQRRDYLESVFRDLAEHQLGLLAGVHEAVGAVVECVSPARVLKLSQESGGRLSSKAARAWETYEKLYEDLMTERGKLFMDVISPALQQGYLSHHDEASRGATDAPGPEDG